MSVFKASIKASIWSSLTEIVLKLISPLVFLILTKILLPSDFGIIAVATNILSFVYIIADLGVSKVLIQLNKSKDFTKKIYNVAFIINLVLGVVFFLVLLLFAPFLAKVYNSPNSENVIRVMSLQVLFFSLCSVQNAIKRKELNFKFLFYTRIATVVIPALISIPFAFNGYGYWAIVFGSTIGVFLAMVVTWYFSNWKPNFFWNFRIFKSLIKKSLWSSIEQLFIWLPMFLDTYLISNFLSQKDLGFYTTSRTLFTTLMGVTLAPILPVLFSTLSKINNDNFLYRRTIFISQKIIFIIASTLGISVFLLSFFIEGVIFNESWNGINKYFGIMFLIMGFEYFFSLLNEGLRAKGYFKEISINTIIAITLTTFSLIFSIKYGLLIYIIVRSLCLYYYLPGIIYYCKKLLKINFFDFILNCKEIIILDIVIIFFNIILKKISLTQREIVIYNFVLFVFMILMLIIIERKFIKSIKNQFKNISND